ncbi:MAG: MerR family transcriptional regulator [Planctomycetota bacterium]
MPEKRRLWRVGDLVRHSGLTRQAIHNYCLMGLLQEVDRTPSGHRLYDDDALRRLDRIERLKRQGKRLAEIAVLLDRDQIKRRTRAADSEQGDGARDEG